MQSILVPTDFSDSSVVALKYALYIAKEFNYNVKVLHVVDKPDFERFLVEEEVRVATNAKLNEKFAHFVEEKILNNTPHLEEVDIEYLLKEGNVTPEILHATDEIEPIIIAMGAKGNGASGWETFWLGGTTKRIVKKSNVPVLVIPDDANFKPIKKIAFASDFILEDFEVISSLLHFSRHFKAPIKIVHVKDAYGEWNEPVLNYLKSKFRDQIAEKTIQIELIEGSNVSECLNDYVVDNEISILSVLDERDTLLSKLFNIDLSYRIATHSHIPTLIFKENMR